MKQSGSPSTNEKFKIILASKSIARKALLEESGFDVIVDPVDVDESYNTLDIKTIVSLLSKRKLDYYLSTNKKINFPLLTADTLVFCDDKIIGKSYSTEEAFEQIDFLKGKTHTVYSAFNLYLPHLNKYYSGIDSTEVTFKNLSKEQIDVYLKTNQWQGAAASYRVQGSASSLIANIEGEVATVVGLPLHQISAIFSTLDF